MGSLDSFHAMKKRAMVELVKGKEIAIRLQTLLREPVRDHEPVSPKHLALQIYRSFSDTLSELSSCTGPTGSDQIPAVDCGGSASSKKLTEVKDQRGRYKRRRTSDSWATVSPTIEDGCAWRKYGQKNILNSEYPRCYFRCTHKSEGCKALKQVQRVKGDQILFQITYFSHHTCKETLRAPQLVVDSDPDDPNIISFKTSIPSKQDEDHQSNDSSKPLIISSVKQEDSLSEDVSHEAKSTLEDPWHDIAGLDTLGYKPVWAQYQEEVESALHGLDMEVDQLSDIDNFNYIF